MKRWTRALVVAAIAALAIVVAPASRSHLQTNTLYGYLALDAERVTEQSLDGGEDIEVHLMPFDDLVEIAKHGNFPHALMTAVLFSVLSYMDRIR